MKRSYLVIFSLLGFLSGVLLYLIHPFPLVVSIPLMGFGLLLALLCRFYWLFLPIGLLIIFVSLGLIRSDLSTFSAQVGDLAYYNDQIVDLEAQVTEVDVRMDQVKYRLESYYIGDSDKKKVKGDLLITSNKIPRYEYGDRLLLNGDLKTPTAFNGFNYQNYLSRFGIYSVMYRPKITKLSSGNGSMIWTGFLWIQNRFMKQINSIFPEPYASFEAGLLVGARKGIPEHLMEDFNRTGLTHIIAISGYNITLIIVIVMGALSSLPRKIAFFSALASIVLFTLFVGASPAVVRASIMGILGLIALNYGRQNNIHITLLFTACLMVIWNPKVLWWDVGFQLSFMAVLGLVYVAPLLDKWSKYFPETLGIRESVQMTMAAQITALPIIVYHFGRLSLVAPLANLLVAFALPPAMFLGFIAVMTSFFLKGLGLLLAYGTSLILGYIIMVTKIMSKIPYASIESPSVGLGFLIGYYILLIGLLFYWNRLKKND